MGKQKTDLKGEKMRQNNADIVINNSTRYSSLFTAASFFERPDASSFVVIFPFFYPYV
jgi:hypothetical protein